MKRVASQCNMWAAQNRNTFRFVSEKHIKCVNSRWPRRVALRKSFSRCQSTYAIKVYMCERSTMQASSSAASSTCNATRMLIVHRELSGSINQRRRPSHPSDPDFPDGEYGIRERIILPLLHRLCSGNQMQTFDVVVASNIAHKGKVEDMLDVEKTTGPSIDKTNEVKDNYRILGNFPCVRATSHGIRTLPTYYGPFEMILFIFDFRRDKSGDTATGLDSGESVKQQARHVRTTEGPGSLSDTYNDDLREDILSCLRLLKSGSALSCISIKTSCGDETVDSTLNWDDIFRGSPLVRIRSDSRDYFNEYEDVNTFPYGFIHNVMDVSRKSLDRRDCSSVQVFGQFHVVPELYCLQYGLEFHHQAPVHCQPADTSHAYLFLPLYGTVVTGFQRGSKQMGIPTANIDVTNIDDRNDLALLSKMHRGVYFGFCCFLDEEGGVMEGKHGVYKMIMNKGQNPTFKAQEQSSTCNADTYEVHIMDTFNQDFYGKRMSVICMVRKKRNH